MNLVERVTEILLKPKDTWAVIAGEQSSIASIYKSYLVFLAAVPAIAAFIGLSLIGASTFGISFRVPIVAGLVNMVVSFILSLVMIYVLSLIVNALAPSFSGEKNALNAFKLVAYGSTAILLAGIFNLLPSLSPLGLLAGLYSIYLLYTGIPVLMKAPEDKAIAYTIVIIVCGIVASLIIGSVSLMFNKTQDWSMNSGIGGSPNNISINSPDGNINIDAAKLEAMTKELEALGKKLEKPADTTTTEPKK